MQYAFSLQLSTLLYMYTYFIPLNVINMGLYKAGVRNCVELLFICADGEHSHFGTKSMIC